MSNAYNTIVAGLNSFDPDERRLSVEASIRFGDREEVVDRLLGLLSDEDKGVRDAVAGALLSIFSEFENSRGKIIKGVCESLCRGDVGLKNLSAEILVKIGKDALDEIMRVANDDDKDVRKMAIDIIGLIRERSAVPFLLEKLNDPDPNVVSAVIETLGNIGDDRAVDVLIDSFSKFEFAQIPIVEALGKIGEKSENAEIIRNFLIETFEQVDDPILKSAIVESLGKVGDESNVDFLMNLMFDKNVAIQKMAIVSIVEICARRGCNFKSNKYFFRSFFERAKEIFCETDDFDFKVYFLDFISRLTEYDEVKNFVLSLLNRGDEISTRAFDIVISNAEDFIRFSLENQDAREDFVDLVELVFYNSGWIFEDAGLKNAVVERLSGMFEQVDSERKIVILNLLRSLDQVAFEDVLRRARDDSDHLVRMYVDSNLKQSG